MARRKSTPKPVEPSIDTNPVVVDEPSTLSAVDNVVAFPSSTPLVHANFSNAKLVPDTPEQWPQRFLDSTTANWRSSIQQNEAINKLRAERSAQLRQSTKYIG
jgi:hypothetical protein